MNKKTCFLLKTGLVAAMSPVGFSVPVSATPLFPRTLTAVSSCGGSGSSSLSSNVT